MSSWCQSFCNISKWSKAIASLVSEITSSLRGMRDMKMKSKVKEEEEKFIFLYPYQWALAASSPACNSSRFCLISMTESFSITSKQTQCLPSLEHNTWSRLRACVDLDQEHQPHTQAKDFLQRGSSPPSILEAQHVLDPIDERLLSFQRCQQSKITRNLIVINKTARECKFSTERFVLYEERNEKRFNRNKDKVLLLINSNWSDSSLRRKTAASTAKLGTFLLGGQCCE